MDLLSIFVVLEISNSQNNEQNIYLAQREAVSCS